MNKCKCGHGEHLHTWPNKATGHCCVGGCECKKHEEGYPPSFETHGEKGLVLEWAKRWKLNHQVREGDESLHELLSLIDEFKHRAANSRERLRVALSFIYDQSQFCKLNCPETGDCITEWCLPHYAGAVLKSTNE